MSVELSRVQTSTESRYLVDLVVGAALIAVGVVLRTLVPGIGGITPNVVIGTYCLSVMLLAEQRPFKVGLASAAGVGLVAAVLCTLISKSEIIGINFASEPVGAIAGFLVFLGLNAAGRKNAASRVVSALIALGLAAAVFYMLQAGKFTLGVKPDVVTLQPPLPVSVLIALAVAGLSMLAMAASSFAPVVVAGLGTLASGFTYITIFKILGHKPDALYYGVLVPVVLYTALVNMVIAQILYGMVKKLRGGRV